MDEKPANFTTKKYEATDLACLQSYQMTMCQEDFTATELRILSCIMLELKDRQIKTYEGNIVEVSDKDREVVINNALITVGTNYSHVKSELKRLRKKTIVIENKRGFKGFGLIDRYEYVNGAEQIKIDVGKDVYPELVTLGKSYTKYSLAFLFKTQSAYAIRWYMLGRHWANKGEFYIAISTLREMFVIEKGEYKPMKNFKEYVIKRPLAIVNRESDIEIKLTKQRKEGRNVRGLIFLVSTKEKEPAIDGYKKVSTITMLMTPSKCCEYLERAMDNALGMIEESGDEGARAKARFQAREPDLYHTMCKWKLTVHEENAKQEVATNSKLLYKRFRNFLKKHTKK